MYWYRTNQSDSPVMHYRERKFASTSQNGLYVDRVSFGSKDAVSGGLRSGDVSPKLPNVSLEDAGDYNCYVSSDRDHDHAVVTLVVIGECGEKWRKQKLPG